MKSLASTPSPTRPRAPALGWRVLRGVAVALAGLAALVGVAWLVLQWAILPRIEYWRPDVERRASQVLGVPVRIGAIEVTDAGAPWRWARALELRDVVFYRATPPGASAPATEALRLPSVRAALSPASFLPGWDGRWQLRFEQLLIEAPQLDVRRERDGRILVAGLSADGPGDDAGAGADWFFSQTEFAIRNGRVVWTDALRGAEPLVLEAVDLVVRNGVRRHAMRLDATPPAALGARFSLRGKFTQPLIGELALPGQGGGLLARPGDWQRWRGTFYADLPSADVEPLRRHVDLPFGLARGSGAARVWIDVKRGAPFAAVADLALRDVMLSPQPDAPALAFAQIQGRLSGRLMEGGRFSGQARQPVGGELRAERFGFTTEDGLTWPATDLGIDWRLGADGAWAGGRLSASRLDLKLVADLAARLPPAWQGGGAHEQLVALAPAGIATGVEARWDGALPAPHHYGVKGRVTGLQLASAAAPERPAASAPEAAASSPAEGASSAPLNPGRPGVQGADVDFEATQAGGEARLAVRAGTLDFPGVFETARIAFDRLDGVISWRVDVQRDGAPGAPAGLEVRARDMRFSNADAEGEFEARWQRATAETAVGARPVAVQPPATGARVAGTVRGPGTLDLTGRLERAELDRLAQYLPLGLPAGIRSYLGRAIQAGQASAVNFKLRGDLRDFPFGAKGGGPVRPGEFRVAARVDKVRFAYLPGAPTEAATPVTPATSPMPAAAPWPAISDVQGDVVFDRTALELRRLRGRLASVGSGDFAFTQVNGGIRNVSHEARLAIEGSGRGPLADVLQFVAATPIGGWIGGALQQASLPPGSAARGAPLELQLALDIPLQHGADTQIRGTAVVAGNDLRLRPELPVLTNARARLDFTERSFKLTGGGARLLGGEATFDGGTQADGSVRFTAQGNATAEGLRASDLPVLSRPAGALSGQAPYRVAVGSSRGQVDWQVSSPLAGMAIDLPAPLGKAAETPLPLRVQSAAAPTAAGAAPRELLRVDLGAEGARLLQAAWLRETGPQGTRVLRGAIGVQDAMPAMQDGVAARVTTPELDIGAWQNALRRLQPAGPAAPSVAGAAATTSATTSATTLATEEDGFMPAAIALRVQRLDIAGRRLNGVAAELKRGAGVDAGGWRAEVDATELKGSIAYQPPGAGRNVRGERTDESAGRVTARLARLVLPRQESDAVSTLLDQASPTTVPALDIEIDELELNGKRLGRVEVDAVNRPPESGNGNGNGNATGPGEWQLNRFRMTTPDAQLSAFGQWGMAQAGASAAAPRRAVIDFRLDIADGGALLDRLGQKDVLRGAKGQLSGQVSWLGSPMAIDYPSLGGQVRVNVGSGQFLKADPGIAKLLGVLSLQALPRRLLLDFRDVFEQGFAFDTVDGEVDIAQGVASTRNLQIKGVQAAVLMEGQADITREMQDLRVWVVPELNAGAASLAVAVINPAVGIGSFLAQLFLRKPLIEAGTREFHITGPWADPKVDRIERARTEPPPDRAENPAAAPSPTKEPS